MIDMIVWDFGGCEYCIICVVDMNWLVGDLEWCCDEFVDIMFGVDYVVVF